jgi:8-oxo-dGTP pyrophosphatase MutT (NUDIX family)
MRAIRYQAAGGVVIDQDDHVLVLRRPSRDEVRLPKGHVEKGESHLEAALREVTEESGYTELVVVADLGHQVVQFEYKGKRVVRDEYYYLCRLGDTPQIERHAQELQFVPDWVGWDQALADLTFAAEREWVRRAHAIQVGQDMQGPQDQSFSTI